MALDYTLHVATQRLPAAYADALGKAAGLSGTGRTRVGAGFSATVLDIHPVAVAMVRDALEFAPTLSVLFAIGDQDAAASLDRMAAALRALLGAERGDAVLVAATGRALLARRAGRLWRNSDDDGFWTETRRAALGPAGEMELPWM